MIIGQCAKASPVMRPWIGDTFTNAPDERTQASIPSNNRKFENIGQTLADNIVSCICYALAVENAKSFFLNRRGLIKIHKLAAAPLYAYCLGLDLSITSVWVQSISCNYLFKMVINMCPYVVCIVLGKNPILSCTYVFYTQIIGIFRVHVHICTGTNQRFFVPRDLMAKFHTVKKGLRSSRPQPECHLRTKLSLAGNNVLSSSPWKVWSKKKSKNLVNFLYSAHWRVRFL